MQTRKQTRVLSQRQVIVVCAVIAGVAMCPAKRAFPEIQWENITSIRANLYSPEDNTYVPINHVRALSADAYDIDCYRWRPDDGPYEWSDWHEFWDDVRSGDTMGDHHMWWTTTLGRIAEPYGIGVIYEAPDASSSDPQVRDAVVKVYASDINRGLDNMGYDDPSDGWDSITLKIWYVRMSARQSGSRSENNDTVNWPEYGGPQLGYNEFDDPEGTQAFCGNTEVRGVIPSGPVETWFDWHQHATGFSWYTKQATGSVRHYDWQSPPADPNDEPFLQSADGISLHPDYGEDVDQIFLSDAPGFFTGPQNNYGTDWPDFMTSRFINGTFSPWVTFHNGMIRISNVDGASYRVQFGIDMYVGYDNRRHWKSDGFPHTP